MGGCRGQWNGPHIERIRNITEDFTKREAKRIVDFAIAHNVNTIIVEDLRNLSTNSRRLKKSWRERLIYMVYRKLLWWIEWEARKHSLAVVRIDPRYTSTTCPYCHVKMIKTGYRRYRCPRCGFEADRDTIAVLNLINRYKSQMGTSLTSPTALQMKDVSPNRCGEPMNPLGRGGGQIYEQYRDEKKVVTRYLTT